MKVNLLSPCAHPGCDNVGENMLCLACHVVLCGRHVHGHSLAHHEETRHPMVCGFVDLSFWCYECESYVDSANRWLRPIYIAMHTAKFGEPPAGIPHTTGPQPAASGSGGGGGGGGSGALNSSSNEPAPHCAATSAAAKGKSTQSVPQQGVVSGCGTLGLGVRDAHCHQLLGYWALAEFFFLSQCYILKLATRSACWCPS